MTGPRRRPADQGLRPLLCLPRSGAARAAHAETPRERGPVHQGLRGGCPFPRECVGASTPDRGPLHASLPHFWGAANVFWVLGEWEAGRRREAARRQAHAASQGPSFFRGVHASICMVPEPAACRTRTSILLLIKHPCISSRHPLHFDTDSRLTPDTPPAHDYFYPWRASPTSQPRLLPMTPYGLPLLLCSPFGSRRLRAIGMWAPARTLRTRASVHLTQVCSQPPGTCVTDFQSSLTCVGCPQGTRCRRAWASWACPHCRGAGQTPGAVTTAGATNVGVLLRYLLVVSSRVGSLIEPHAASLSALAKRGFSKSNNTSVELSIPRF
jgi:hypothetical protein